MKILNPQINDPGYGYEMKEEEYKCVNYNSVEGRCITCDGFGRNLDDKVKVEECYSGKT